MKHRFLYSAVAVMFWLTICIQNIFAYDSFQLDIPVDTEPDAVYNAYIQSPDTDFDLRFDAYEDITDYGSQCVILNKTTHYDSTGKMTRYLMFKYDDAKRTIYCMHHDINNKKYQTEKVSYNSNKIPTRSDIYDANGKLVYYYKFLYDSKGRNLGAVRYDADNTILDRQETKYDNSGRVTKRIFYQANGKLIGYYGFSYDRYGRIATRCTYNGKKLYEKRIYQYNSANLANKVLLQDSNGATRGYITLAYVPRSCSSNAVYMMNLFFKYGLNP